MRQTDGRSPALKAFAGMGRGGSLHPREGGILPVPRGFPPKGSALFASNVLPSPCLPPGVSSAPRGSGLGAPLQGVCGESWTHPSNGLRSPGTNSESLHSKCSKVSCRDFKLEETGWDLWLLCGGGARRNGEDGGSPRAVAGACWESQGADKGGGLGPTLTLPEHLLYSVATGLPEAPRGSHGASQAESSR